MGLKTPAAAAKQNPEIHFLEREIFGNGTIQDIVHDVACARIHVLRYISKIKVDRFRKVYATKMLRELCKYRILTDITDVTKSLLTALKSGSTELKSQKIDWVVKVHSVYRQSKSSWESLKRENNVFLYQDIEDARQLLNAHWNSIPTDHQLSRESIPMAHEQSRFILDKTNDLVMIQELIANRLLDHDERYPEQKHLLPTQ